MQLTEKLAGETPLQALDRLRAEQGIPAEVPLSYAGRLDPMASGVLLVLEGDECRDRARYLGLDKAYELEILLDASSDTGDVLGLVAAAPESPVSLLAASEAARKLVGPYRSPYPAFSSRTVQGRPLFRWALEGRLDEIAVPEQDGAVRDLAATGLRSLTTPELDAEVTEKLGILRPDAGDFRIDAVRESWQRLLADSSERTWQVLSLAVRTSAGVYMRTLADDLARLLGTRGLAYAIRRTAIFLPD